MTGTWLTLNENYLRKLGGKRAEPRDSLEMGAKKDELWRKPNSRHDLLVSLGIQVCFIFSPSGELYNQPQ
jgi:hypothetical protein